MMGRREGSMKRKRASKYSSILFEMQQLNLKTEKLEKPSFLMKTSPQSQQLRMSMGGSSYYQKLKDIERTPNYPRPLELNLNNPPPSEAMAAPLGVETQHRSSDCSDDECLIISPATFEEAVNNSQRNSYRRVRRTMQELTEVVVTESFESVSADRWSILLGRYLTFNRIVSANDEPHSKTPYTDISIPVAREEAPAEPKPPVLSCAICISELVEETSTKCGHIFCKACIEKAIATQHKCPNCRRKLRKNDIFRVHLPYTG